MKQRLPTLFLSSQPPTPIVRLPITELTTLGNPYKWPLTVFVFFCPDYFTSYSVLKAHACRSMCLNFFPSWGQIIFCSGYISYFVDVSTHPLVDTWAASTVQPSWVMLLWTWVYGYISLRPRFQVSPADFGFKSKSFAHEDYGNFHFLKHKEYFSTRVF